MNIIEIIPSLKNRAGAETFLVDLCSEFSKKTDVNLTLIILYNEKINEKYLSILEDCNIKIIFMSKHRGIDLKCSSKLRKIIKEINPDIVHMHLCCTITYFFAFGFLKRKWKLVHTVHNLAEKDGSSIDRFIRRIYVKKRELFLIAISEKILESTYAVYKEKRQIYCIYNGVKLFKYSELEKEYDIVHVGRFYEQKNHPFILEVFKKMLSKNNLLKMVFVGDGPGLKSAKKFCQDNNLVDNISFLGMIDNVPEILLKSKVFFLPSLYEGNPISILEALCAGLPIVASNVGGVPDVVKERNGFLFNEFNIEKVANLLQFALKDTNYKIFSTNNRSDALKYSISVCANDYYNFFIGAFTNHE